MMKKSNLYKIHRYLSIICLLPVLFWCVSGLTHPIMANWFRIQPAHRKAPVTNIDTTLIQTKVTEVVKGDLATFHNLGVKTFANKMYYFFEKENTYHFVDVSTGNVLAQGAKKYATYLAKYYLGNKNATVTAISVVHQFNSEYKVINRHLPAYKVSFNDDAQSDVYVHLPSGNLGTINNHFKRTQLWVFSTFHNWDFLGDNHTLKPLVVFSFSLATFVVGILGLYLYAINRKKYKKRKKQTDKLKNRNIHRYISVPASIFFLMFSFSGAYHAFQKFEPYNLNQYQPKPVFNHQDIHQNIFSIDGIERVQRISMVKMEGKSYYRVSFVKNPQANYYSADCLELLLHGDELYAKQRAIEITGLKKEEIVNVNLITRFQNSYGFINKRLPVYEVIFKDDKATKCYVETASGIPGALVNKAKKREALSFVMLHKFHFLDFLGKGNRDIIIALAVLSVLLVLYSGLRVFVQLVKNR